MQRGWPAFWHFWAAVRKKSQVHLSVSSLFPPVPLAGYICVKSSPTASLKMSIRPTDGSVSVLEIAGGAIQCPFCLRSEEHTPELQSRLHLVCRLLLEKKRS